MIVDGVGLDSKSIYVRTVNVLSMDDYMVLRSGANEWTGYFFLTTCKLISMSIRVKSLFFFYLLP